MRKAVFVLLPLCLSAAGQSATAASFAGLVEAAAAYDARLKAGQYSLLAKKEGARAARGVLYPQFSISSGYNFIERHYTEEKNDSSQHRLVINQTIINGRRYYDYRAAKADSAAERYNFAITEQSVYQEVVQARLDLHMAEERYLLLEKRLQAVSEQLHLVERRWSGGLGTYLDVGLVQAELETIKADLASAASASEDARQTLTRLTSQRVSVLPQLKKEFVFPALPPKSESLDNVLHKSPELLYLRHQVKIQHMREKSALAQRLPSLEMTGERGYSSNENNYFSLAVQLRIPLYSGGVNEAALHVAIAQRQFAEETLTDAGRRSEENLHRLYSAATAIVEQERRLQSAIVVQQRLLDKTRVAWLEGVRLAQDVIEAEQNLFDSRLRQNILRYHYLEILTMFKQLSGEIDEVFLRQLDSYFE